jgi:hypothetical protein
MQKLWCAVVLMSCVALWGGTLVCADENDEHQGGGAGLTTASESSGNAHWWRSLTHTKAHHLLAL